MHAGQAHSRVIPACKRPSVQSFGVSPNRHATASSGFSDDAFANITSAATNSTDDFGSWKPRTTPPVPPSTSQSKREVFRYIHEQLDCFGKHSDIYGKFQLLGPTERRSGGQAVVQFARGTDGSGIEAFALKFFGKRADYDEEAEVYRTSPLRHFMPGVVRYADNLDEGMRDPFGGTLPPCIIMEKGESLQDRAQKSRIDVFTAAQILGHVSERIAELHEAGYVHRDLKPGNLMWQPRTYTWVLIDFGLASQIGEEAVVGCTPSYAAPEMVAAFISDANTLQAESAIDAWALGVIAFELLLERPAFGKFCGVPEICNQLADDRRELPWDDARLSSSDRKKLGMFRKPILKLLRRNPSERITAREFCNECCSLFAINPLSTLTPPDADSAPAR